MCLQFIYGLSVLTIGTASVAQSYALMKNCVAFYLKASNINFVKMICHVKVILFACITSFMLFLVDFPSGLLFVITLFF